MIHVGETLLQIKVAKGGFHSDSVVEELREFFEEHKKNPKEHFPTINYFVQLKGSIDFL